MEPNIAISLSITTKLGLADPLIPKDMPTLFLITIFSLFISEEFKSNLDATFLLALLPCTLALSN